MKTLALLLLLAIPAFGATENANASAGQGYDWGFESGKYSHYDDYSYGDRPRYDDFYTDSGIDNNVGQDTGTFNDNEEKL
jgi:hypothetical protein